MKILLTLDYELFNGKKCGTVQNCLLRPMKELLKVLDKYGLKATLFVDTVFVNRLGELGQHYPELQDEYNKILEQLRSLYEQGHDLQLHIHPNWLHASYNEGQWQSILTDYKLSDMLDEEVDRMFKEGKELLGSITGDPQKIIAYRAGAYCIQTYSKFVDVFEKYGIRIDSSVFRHQKSITEKWQHYDYTHIPVDYSYAFSKDVCLKDDKGSFLEISIPTYHISKFTMLCYKFGIRGKEIKKWGDGLGSINMLSGKSHRFFNIIKGRLMPSIEVASIDSSKGWLLDHIFKKEKREGNDYMLIMGHPKNFTPYSLECLSAFLQKLSKDEHQFVTILNFGHCCPLKVVDDYYKV